MNKSLLLIAIIGTGGLIFFPEQTRELAWKSVHSAGNVAADAAASAFVSVGDRIDAKLNGGDNEAHPRQDLREGSGQGEPTIGGPDNERQLTQGAPESQPFFKGAYATSPEFRPPSYCAH